jgi:hypothetical protein
MWICDIIRSTEMTFDLPPNEQGRFGVGDKVQLVQNPVGRCTHFAAHLVAKIQTTFLTMSLARKRIFGGRGDDPGRKDDAVDWRKISQTMFNDLLPFSKPAFSTVHKVKVQGAKS